MAYLALVRHGESKWNEEGKWTGWTDISLNEDGRKNARNAATELKDIKFDIAYTSDLKRAKETLEEIITQLNLNLPIIEAPEIKEKNYGIYTGKNKWEVKEKVGEKEFMKIRRSWDYIIPEGESLKQVYERAVPYYQKEILPKLMGGKNVLLVAHGNSLRALIKYFDKISDEDIPNLELATGEIYLYTIDKNGQIVGKVQKAHRENKV